jgi:hypothetical protein
MRNLAFGLTIAIGLLLVSPVSGATRVDLLNGAVVLDVTTTPDPRETASVSSNVAPLGASQSCWLAGCSTVVQVTGYASAGVSCNAPASCAVGGGHSTGGVWIALDGPLGTAYLTGACFSLSDNYQYVDWQCHYFDIAEEGGTTCMEWTSYGLNRPETTVPIACLTP